MVEFPNEDVFKVVFNLANSADPHEMPHSPVFHLGLQC